MITFSGNNTYTGGTTLNSGTLGITNNQSLGTGSLMMNGGTLQTQNPITLNNNISLAIGTVDVDGQASTLAGLISDKSGPGSLSVTDSAGGGVLTLTAANTYTGGTNLNGGVLSVGADNNLGGAAGGLSFNGGTLQTTAGLSSARGVTLNAGGGTIDTQANSDTLSGVIGGAGALTKLGAGTLTLSGANTYTGGTDLNAGVVSVAADGALGGAAGALTFNGGTLQTTTGISSARNLNLVGAGVIDTQGNSDSFSGIISGAGSLSNLNGGALTLSGANTFSGGLNIANGTLNVSADNNMGAAANPLSLNASSLVTTAGLTSSRNIALTGADTIDTQGNTDTLTGILSGAGSLTKLGAGILNLGAANTYSGGTMLSAGTIQLGAANGLPSAQALSIGSGATFDMNGFNQTLGATVNNGTLNTRAGTLTVNGNYSGTGALSSVLSLAGPAVNVTGTATVTGQPLTFSLASRLPGTYTVLNAGTLSGTFASITGLGGVAFVPTYTATALTLAVSIQSLSGQPGLTPNQNQVASAFDGTLTPTADMVNVISTLNGLSGSALQTAMDQVSPLPLQAMSGMSFSAAGAHSTVVEERMASLQMPESEGLGMAMRNSRDSQSQTPTLIASSALDWTYLDFNTGPNAQLPWGLFASGIGSISRVDSTSGSAGSQPGYDYHAGGGAVGWDVRPTDHLAGGVTLGYLNGSATLDSGLGQITNDVFHYGVYGTAYNERSRASLYVGGASDSMSTRRNIAAFGRTATATPHGHELNFDGQLSTDLPTGDLVVAPFLGMAYDQLKISPFTENGAGALDLDVNPETARSLRSRAGAKLSRTLGRRGFALTPYASLGWQHEFEDQQRAIDARLQSGTGGALSVTTANPSRDSGLLGLGTTIDWSKSLSGKLAYSGEIGSGFMEHDFTANLRYKF